MKLGANGSLIKQGDKIYSVKAVKANCIDTTGAGDMYAAGFLHGYSKDLPLDVCGKIGSIVSANVVETVGAKLTEAVWQNVYKAIEEI